MEHVLQYVWKHRLFQPSLKTTDGIAIEVLDVGQHNTDEGPDFFNAKVRIGDKVWVGNIEIHKTSEDWYKHKHHLNSNYNSVILHVVERANRVVTNEANLEIPQCEIVYSEKIKENIDFLLNADVAIPCCNYLRDFPSINMQGWVSSLLLERLQRKANDITKLLERFNNSYADVFYILLSRSMGFGINSDAFEQLALSLPLSNILKQGDALHTEALLFGQAGILEDIGNPDEYTRKLQQEYAFLKNKYHLTPLNKHTFRNLRMRPASSPYIRIAQLATLLQNIQGLFGKVLKSKDLGQIRLLFHVNASEYWQTHYVFGEESPRKNKYIGDASLDVMIINTVVPLIFSYGKKVDDETYIDRAMLFLENLKPESNSIVRQFASYGVPADNAYYTQAIIQLKREYCERKKCLYCRVGFKLLSEK